MAAMNEQRNFRSNYLGKVGIKCIEEKKNIEMLLTENPIDLSKLAHFCIRFPLPSNYRATIWKILLGISPVYQESMETLSDIRVEMYEGMQEALQAMGHCYPENPPCTHLYMYLLEQEMIPLDSEKMLKKSQNQCIMKIASALEDTLETEQDVYYVTSRYVTTHQKKIDNMFPTLHENFLTFLQKEDEPLFSHLQAQNDLSALPVRQWMMTSFAEILPGNSFERVWDKIIGGGVLILVCTAVAIVLNYRRQLLQATSPEAVTGVLQQISADSGDVIVTKAIDMWQAYGSLLQPPAAGS